MVSHHSDVERFGLKSMWEDTNSGVIGFQTYSFVYKYHVDKTEIYKSAIYRHSST